MLDNPKVDEKAIMKAYYKTHSTKQVALKVLQDVFHAKARIVKELNRYHPDYKAA